jgi:hypothetical protein
VVLDVDVLAGAVEHPAVVGAGVELLVAAARAAQRGAAVGAGVHEAVHLAVLAAADDHRLATHVGGEEVARVRNLAFVAQVQPAALEDVFHLELEQLGVEVHVAIDGEHAVVDAVVQQGLELLDFHGSFLLVGAGGTAGAVCAALIMTVDGVARSRPAGTNTARIAPAGSSTFELQGIRVAGAAS